MAFSAVDMPVDLTLHAEEDGKSMDVRWKAVVPAVTVLLEVEVTVMEALTSLGKRSK
jgi:hypothetical protein